MPDFQLQTSGFPAYVTFKDKHGKIHRPPDPPLSKDGLLPWQSPPGKVPRTPPLKSCPSRACRRLGRCVDQIKGKYCRKTHLTDDEWRDALAELINKLGEESEKHTSPEERAKPLLSEAEAMHHMRQCLIAACQEGEKEEVKKWQQNWVDEMRRKEQAK